MLSVVVLSVMSCYVSLFVCDDGVCGQTIGWIKMKLGTEVGIDPGHIVRWAPSSLQKGHNPNFRPMSVVAKRLDGSRCHLVQRWASAQGNCVRWGPRPLPKRGTAPKFLANVCCGQTDGWIKMSLGTEVGLGPAHVVLDGDPAPPKGHRPSIFGPYLLWPNGRMDRDATWYGGRPQPGAIVLDGDPAPPPKLGQHLHFSAHVYCGQTAVWIKMPHGTEIDLGPGHTVLDGDQAPPPSERGTAVPLFGRYLLWPNSRPSQLLLSTC